MGDQGLKDWVRKQLSVSSEAGFDWQPLSGDASFRRYFRCQWQEQSYIVAFAPPQTEKNHEFVALSALLKRSGIKASEVLAFDYEQGYLLQHDLGSCLLSDVLNENSADDYYQKALAQLLQMQKIKPSELTALAPYDADALQLELSYFVEWFVSKLLRYHLNEQEQRMLDAFFTELTEAALQQPQGFVHRDYHCRNIMLDTNNELACIDFQDALLGPLSYDVVSLLRDCYVVWPEQRVESWLYAFWQLLIQDNVIHSNFTYDAFLVAFDLMGLQRHIKVLGVFARLSLRDEKHAYLQDLNTVVQYIRNVLSHERLNTAASQNFHQWFEEILMPLIKQQAWYDREATL